MQYNSQPSGILYAKLYRKVHPRSRQFICFQMLADPNPSMTIATAQHIALLTVPDDIDPYGIEAHNAVVKAASIYAQRGNYSSITVVDPTLNLR
jgi:hypothetical protein